MFSLFTSRFLSSCTSQCRVSSRYVVKGRKLSSPGYLSPPHHVSPPFSTLPPPLPAPSTPFIQLSQVQFTVKFFPKIESSFLVGKLFSATLPRQIYNISGSFRTSSPSGRHKHPGETAASLLTCLLSLTQL